LTQSKPRWVNACKRQRRLLKAMASNRNDFTAGGLQEPPADFPESVNPSDCETKKAR
jgi:hypothetical protein